jgi:Scytalone dehydratase
VPTGVNDWFADTPWCATIIGHRLRNARNFALRGAKGFSADPTAPKLGTLSYSMADSHPIIPFHASKKPTRKRPIQVLFCACPQSGEAFQIHHRSRTSPPNGFLSMATQPTLEGPPLPLVFTHHQPLTHQKDVLGCQAALYEWAESYDTKDWDRLSKCIAPTLRVGLPLLPHSPPYPPKMLGSNMRRLTTAPSLTNSGKPCPLMPS